MKINIHLPLSHLNAIRLLITAHSLLQYIHQLKKKKPCLLFFHLQRYISHKIHFFSVPAICGCCCPNGAASSAKQKGSRGYWRCCFGSCLSLTTRPRGEKSQENKRLKKRVKRAKGRRKNQEESRLVGRRTAAASSNRKIPYCVSHLKPKQPTDFFLSFLSH